MTAPYGVAPRRTNATRIATALFCLLVALAPAFAPAGAQARTLRLLVLGDSLAAGYGLAAPDGFQARLAAALKAAGRDVAIIDGAVSGDTTAGGRARLDWTMGDTPDAAPDAALVELGGNDGLRGIDPANTEQNLAAILDALAAKRIPTLLTGMEAPPNLGRDYTDRFRAIFTRLGRRPGLLFDPFFLEGVAGDPALNQPDNIHPNAQGVNKEVARLLPLVQTLLDQVKP